MSVHAFKGRTRMSIAVEKKFKGRKFVVVGHVKMSCRAYVGSVRRECAQ
jgi:hypothetical protein